MRICIFLLLILFTGVNSGCLSNFRTHAIHCAMVGEQKICFVREVWGFNGDQVSLTTSDNVCHKPSEENDYVSKGLRSQQVIFAKIEAGKFYVYAERLYAPQNRFPVEVILESYDPARPVGEDLIKEGYQKFDLSKENMTWCFKDVF